MLNDIILIALFILFYLYWFKAQQAKEIAFNAAQERCLQAQVLLLDNYVALNSLRLTRTENGNICIRRCFSFEFSSTGDERYNGSVVMISDKVQSIYLPPYRIQ